MDWMAPPVVVTVAPSVEWKLCGARLDEDAVGAVQLVAAEQRAGAVAGAAEVGGDLGGGEGLAGAEFTRRGVDLRDRREQWAGGEAIVDDALVVVIEVDEDAYADEDDREDEDRNEAEEIAREQAAPARGGGALGWRV